MYERHAPVVLLRVNSPSPPTRFIEGWMVHNASLEVLAKIYLYFKPIVTRQARRN